ncbi:alpha,alpha-trehalose-phosphate synthase (UDP-forming) [Galdieria sulphuraria]|uniref:Alpha,alpha-trehalose-phosphate synthase (UDP-forming) n=1 Tax=Galdieria sulphuraria TaxID=130081 RepID=M2Y3Y8_GALSU|nr:alpha,alpha-trehalose-phosphate synthase (UDP-forming) [Galdieria sulphuraria]EME30539.1 alpha,alpha-trehalose-phosphate synthase (UDP-forming) [Galdieria sulphuraria]|eukprot:XP_005707059.1 alpha,alpha-trehalose-phosphate synthase (UDP-forming) [Galdieria sulphuraria]
MELPTLQIPETRQEEEVGVGEDSEEVLLNKIQNIQLQLAEIRELKANAVPSKRVSNVSSSRLGKDFTSRLLVVTSRLPVMVDWSIRNKPTITVSSGGLVPAIFYLKKKFPVYWFGALGSCWDMEKQDILKHKLQTEYGFIPVFSQFHDYELYQSFCNSVLWPLFHYLLLHVEGERSFRLEAWEAYKRVNMDFVKVIMEHYESGDFIWIHDFHLLLVPKMIRERCSSASIGFFLHTPFPSSEVYRMLPNRRELIEGVLGSDLIGFHSYDYARHFLSVCSRLLGLDVRPNAVDNRTSQVSIGIFPLGIDTTLFSKALETRIVKDRIQQLRSEFKDKKIIIGVDRLDYIKGIPHKLLAIECFLDTYPEWIGHCVFIQVAIPSISASGDYYRFRAEMYQLVGRLNGKFSSMDYVPIHFLNQMISFEDLCALYSVGDVAMITSLRDGMNLVSYEYIYCQYNNYGVLILSELTGAAHSLPGAILCNPWNTEEVADCIHKSLVMSEQERRMKHQKLYRYVISHTCISWGDHFVADWYQTITERRQMELQLQPLHIESILESYQTSHRRLLLLDYDGTLTSYRTLPELARPTSHLVHILKKLSSNRRNRVFVISGRDKNTLSSWLAMTGTGLAAEYGFYYCWPKNEEINDNEPTRDKDWVPLWYSLISNEKNISWERISQSLNVAKDILKRFEDCTPGSFISEKETCLTWHFRDADPDFAYSQAMEARQHLEQALMETPLEILMGQKILYVRPKGVDKGSFVQFILTKLQPQSPDFILCIGDDRTDEQMFQQVESTQAQVSDWTFICISIGKCL